MLPDSFFMDQIGRLSCLDGYPFHAAGVTELAGTLKAVCPDDRFMAAKLVSHFTEAGGRCPDPRAIRSAWHDMTRGTGGSRESCPRCHGIGFISRDKLINGRLYAFSAPCSCRAVPSDEEAA